MTILNQHGEPIRHKEMSQKPTPDMMRESAYATDSMVMRMQGGIDSYNPDQLVARKGMKVYKNMLRDDQVKAAFLMKTAVITSRALSFDYTPESAECAEFLQRNIEDLLRGSWKQALRSILMGKAYGFSLTEKVYRVDQVDGKDRWVLDKLKRKPSNTFDFKVDEYDNILEISQDHGGSKRVLNPKKFIHYINAPEFDDVWGESDLKAAYKPFWEKDVVTKFWNIYMERAAGGFMAAIPQENAVNLGSTQQLERVLSNTSGFSGIKMPSGYDLKVEIPSDNKSYETAINKKDTQIARALLVPNFLGYTEQGGHGSYAQSSTVLDIFMMVIEEDTEYLADLLNEQLFAELAWWNFGIKEYPRIKFNPYTAEQKRAIATAWIEAVDKGAVTNTLDDELYTRTLLMYPEKQLEDLEQEAAKKENEEELEEIEEKPEGGSDDDVEDGENAQKPTASDKADSEAQQSNSSNVHAAVVAGTLLNAESEDDIDYEKPMFIDRINFVELNKSLDAIDADFYANLSSSTDTAYNELKSAFKAVFSKYKGDKSVKKETVDSELSDAISKKTKSALNTACKSYLERSYNKGRSVAMGALDKAMDKAPSDVRKKLKLKARLTEHRACMFENWTTVHFVEGISLDAAKAWFSSTAFRITGDITDTMLKAASDVMISGIINEQSQTDMINELAQVLSPLVGSYDEETGKINKEERVRLENIVRTNMSTIFTQAQLSFYSDPDLNGFVEGFEYSSIMDSRTTAVCRRLDGAKYPMSDPIWSSVTPPNHYMCRSVLIPVTIVDDWKKSARKYSQSQLPSKGFGRSSFPSTLLNKETV